MLTGKQKSYLKGLAHTMQPIIQVGKNGVNDALIKTVYDALEARELVKVSILQNCFEEPKAIAAEIAEVINAEVIQVIGKTIVFYKESSKKKQQLPSKRYNHTLGVVATSEQLAKRYNASVESAQIAALLHDIAKYLPNDLLKEKLESAKETDYLNYSPLVWHAPVGAIVAKETYQIKDSDILNAIKYHTTGKAAMTTLEKIVFLADYIEPNRTQPGVEEIRKLATKDLDVAVAQTLADTVAYLSSKGKGDIHPDTLAAYEYYRQYL